MRPLSDCPPSVLRAARGLLFDIDDTLTTDGRLTAAAYGAVEQLSQAGLRVIPITGRPAGWCDHIARMWPVDAVVGENGAFWFRYDHRTRRMQRRFVDTAEARANNRARLQQIGERILAAVPGSAIAADQGYRECDLAIDFCEDVPRLPDTAIEAIVRLMTGEGMTAKVSSIHVNGWFGEYDKLTMTKRLFADAFGESLDSCKADYLFAGDSPNDAPMFGYFPHSVGVANVRDVAGRLSCEPAYITCCRAGDGFAELAQHLIQVR